MNPLLASHYREILVGVGENPEREGLLDTLTRQIAEAIEQITGAAGVAVVIEAKHMCMMMRGVEKQNSVMTTSVMLGNFRDSSTTRQEFLQLIGRR